MNQTLEFFAENITDQYYDKIVSSVSILLKVYTAIVRITTLNIFSYFQIILTIFLFFLCTILTFFKTKLKSRVAILPFP